MTYRTHNTDLRNELKEAFAYYSFDITGAYLCPLAVLTITKLPTLEGPLFVLQLPLYYEDAFGWERK